MFVLIYAYGHGTYTFPVHVADVDPWRSSPVILDNPNRSNVLASGRISLVSQIMSDYTTSRDRPNASEERAVVAIVHPAS